MTSGLVDGGSYTVQAWGNDGRIESASGSMSTKLAVNTSPPGAMTITCTGVTSGTWYTTRPASSTTCSFNGSASTVAFDWTLNNQPQKSLLANSSGNADNITVPIPTSGVVGISAHGKDIVNNITEPKAFGFGSGDAGLITPVDKDRTSSTISVEAQAPDGGSGVLARVQYRPSGNSSGSWTDATGVSTGAGGFWMGGTTSSGGAATTGPLIWDAEGESGISAPSVNDVRVCFTYPGVERCTPSRQVTVVPHAFGGSFPTQDAGPGRVALFTGEFELEESDIDVPAYSGSLSLARSHRTLGGATTITGGVFGPGWVADLAGPEAGSASAEVVDNTATDGSITLVDAGGESSTYVHDGGGKVAQATGVYMGDLEAGTVNEKLELTDSSGKFLTLTEEDQTKTVWKHLGSGKWVVEKVDEPGATATTTYAHDADGLVTGIFAPAPSGVTCTATTQDPGCRALLLTYTTATSPADKRVSQVDLRIYDPKPTATGEPGSGAGMTTTAVAKYAYDSAGVLTDEWDPRLDKDGTSLKTHYTYQSVGGKKMLETLTAPGEKPWRFAFDGNSRFSTAKRELPAGAGTGDATWTVAYDVGLSGTGLPDLRSTATTTWGQTVAPVGAVAVFAPDKTPSGTIPADGDWAYGSISYFNREGRTTNTASYGAGAWQVDSNVYDEQGNEIWSLDQGNRNIALASSGNTASLANSLASTTIYNADGTRVEQTYGPTRSVVLKDGTQIEARTKSETVYDDEAAAESVPVPGRPTPVTGAPPLNLVAEERESVIDAVGTVFDTQKTRNQYDPVVTGDGDGWTLGAPTRVTTAVGTAVESTTLTRFDTEGKVIESRTPQGVAAHNTSWADTRSTINTYYTVGTNSADSACGSKPEWAGMVCKTGPAGQPLSGKPIPVTRNLGFDALLNATKTTETSDTTTRTSTTAYDAAGRKKSESIAVTGADSGDQSVPDTTFSYTDDTGVLKSVTAGGSTMTTTYDSWGRALTQTDGTGNTATTTYDIVGRAKTFNDGKGAYTFTYDGTDAAGKDEHRGLITKVDVGLANGPSEFNVASNADGASYLTVYPNGIKATTSFDTAGAETALKYVSSGGDPLFAFSNTLDAESRVRFASSPGSSQAYSYDDRDRLTKVEDSVNGACTTRAYGFSLDSDRTSLATALPDVNGACTVTGADTALSTFDGADRLTSNTYDNLGRTRTVPKGETDQPAGGDLTAAYFANDMVAKLSQTVPDGASSIVKTKSFTLDAAQRLSETTDTTAAVNLHTITNHYSDGSDSPAWIEDKTRPDATTAWATTWSRNVVGPNGDLSMIQPSTGTAKIQITDIHGDIVATMDNTTTISGVSSYVESTEYGAPRNPAAKLGQRYEWLGAKQRSDESLGGFTLMGARLYNPTTGRFLSMDSVRGGNDNAYTYPVDPINQLDPEGLAQIYYIWTRWLRASKTWVIWRGRKIWVSYTNAFRYRKVATAVYRVRYRIEGTSWRAVKTEYGTQISLQVRYYQRTLWATWHGIVIRTWHSGWANLWDYVAKR
ncbi:MAG: RHS repeat-associated core domain-containing protein [Aeromicrobium sp.]